MFWNQEPLCERLESLTPDLQKSWARGLVADYQENRLPPAGPNHEPGRRKHRRFPISMPAEYFLDGSKQPTTIANISRGGVFIHAKEKLPVGRPVRVAIDWPVALDGRCPLSLVVFGRVVRCQKTGAAISIHRYEFRLRPKSRSIS